MNAEKVIKDGKASREGFSLIELIIAIAIVGIVMSGVLLLITYATNSMRRTNNQVTIQNQVKDAVTHITTHIQEASEARFYNETDSTPTLITANAKNYVNGVPSVIDFGIYWKGLYQETTTSDPESVIYYTECHYPNSWDSSRTAFDNTEAFFNDKKDAIDYDKVFDTTYGSLTNGIKGWAKDNIASEAIFNSADKRTFILCRNVDVFQPEEMSVETVTSAPSTTPTVVATESPSPSPSGTTNPAASATPTPTPICISSKSITFTIKLKNTSGDTEFKTTKTVYLRNQ